jgi:hypothetical protein
MSASHRAVLDAMLLKIPGVEGADMSGLRAYFIKQKMFACISGEGVGIRLPVATCTEMTFARQDVAPFQPKGVTSTREWIQINHEDSNDYEKDLEVFQQSIEFVKAAKSR